jgi:hypothetical protein
MPTTVGTFSTDPVQFGTSSTTLALDTPAQRLVCTGSTVLHLVAKATFSVGTISCGGAIIAIPCA